MNKVDSLSSNINLIQMISKHFQFYDKTEQYYSYASLNRFYEVFKNHSQLDRILLTKHSLEMLQKESKEYKKMMIATLAGSLLTLYPFNKGIKFGPGMKSFLAKTLCNAAILTVPSISVHIYMRERMSAVKKKVFNENRPAFRRFELTGDILQVRDDYELVD